MAQNLTQYTFRHRPAPQVDSSRSKIIFAGSEVSFSERVLAVCRAEFPSHDIYRVQAVSDVSVARRLHDDVQLIIFEAQEMQSALDDPQRLITAAGSARIIFSLSNPQDAASFLSARGDGPGLDSVGFLPLNSQMDIWITVMHLLLCGQCYVPQDVVDALILNSNNRQPGSSDNVWSALTTREREVLRLVAQGTPNKNIATDLELSVHTVKLHIHNMFKKIGVSNRTCAASWFMQHKNGQTKHLAGKHGGA